MSERTITIEHNGVEYAGRAGTIKSTMLGYEDHGILSAYLTIEGTSWGSVLVGGWGLDSWNDAEQRRLGTAFGLDHLIAIMSAVGVSKWEDLNGRTVLVLFKDDLARGIAHITDEKKILVFSEHARAWEARNGEGGKA